MKRLFLSLFSIALCSYCGPYASSAFAQQAPLLEKESIIESESAYAKLTHEERAARRAERLAEFERAIDSIVMSHNFQFNPQSVQMLPAGTTRFLTNPNYMVTVLRGSVDVCLPYYVGYTPPYRYVLLNVGAPRLTDFITQQTDEGWIVSFKCYLYASQYNFHFDINKRYGGATLTITNQWYNAVQYSGTITKVY